MLYIGSHVSYKNDTQLVGSVKEALSYGSTAFMFYTGAPQNTQRGTINDGLTLEAMNIMKENNIELDKVIVHAPYIVNLGNNIDPDKWQFSQDFIRQELDRCETLGIKYMVLHPGAAVGLDRTEAMDNIIRGLNNILVEDDTTIVLLETMAGKGTEIGINLEEVSYLLNGIKLKDKVGVC